MAKPPRISPGTPPLEKFSRNDILAESSQIFERLLTVNDLADAFGLAPQTIRNWVALRQIPFIRIGGKTKFRKRSIEAWLNRKEEKPCL